MTNMEQPNEDIKDTNLAAGADAGGKDKTVRVNLDQFPDYFRMIQKAIEFTQENANARANRKTVPHAEINIFNQAAKALNAATSGVKNKNGNVLVVPIDPNTDLAKGIRTILNSIAEGNRLFAKDVKIEFEGQPSNVLRISQIDSYSEKFAQVVDLYAKNQEAHKAGKTINVEDGRLLSAMVKFASAAALEASRQDNIDTVILPLDAAKQPGKYVEAALQTQSYTKGKVGFSFEAPSIG